MEAAAATTAAALIITARADTLLHYMPDTFLWEHSSRVIPPVNDALHNNDLGFVPRLHYDTRLLSPLRHCPPGPVLIGQDVEDLLFQLISGHVISVLSCANEVITHFLLFPSVRSILGTVGLEGSEQQDNE